MAGGAGGGASEERVLTHRKRDLTIETVSEIFEQGHR